MRLWHADREGSDLLPLESEEGRRRMSTLSINFFECMGVLFTAILAIVCVFVLYVVIRWRKGGKR